MRIRPIARWYDCWVGAYYNKERQELYIMLVPCLGFIVQFAHPARARRRADPM